MTTEFLRDVLLKDLAAVRNEMHAYSREEDLWVCPTGISNSGGTLVLHVTGNLRHFIGSVLGGIAYVRDRETEFTDLHVPRVELETRIDRAQEAVESALENLDDDQLSQEYPLDIDGVRISTGMFLVRLVSHLAYHLGQINCHRRVVTAKSCE